MMHRPTVGMIALGLLLLGAILFLVGDERAAAWKTGCLRVGLLMAALWLAMPHLKGMRPLWLLLCLPIGLIVVVLVVKQHPLSMALVAVIALLLGYLSIASRPRRSR
jgi:hypothetical protein